MRRRALLMVAAVVGLALLLPAGAFARGDFDVEQEFQLKPWISIHIGGLDMSINKAVAYIWLAGIVTIVVGLLLMRLKLKVKPDGRQTLGETIYEIAHVQIAEQGLPRKAVARWFPYVASLLLFIWVTNIIGFLPLPLTNEKFHIGGVELPTFGIYAATSSLSVALMLALVTFCVTHYEGIKWNGVRKYFKSWILDAPGPALILIVPIEIISQFMRLISLSVRLFANMLAGHMLILVMIGLIFVLQHWYLAVVSVPVAVGFYLFEVVIVCSIQAYIFAALSAIYIGSAIEPEH